MTFKYAVLAGAAMMLVPMTVSAASAEDDSYVCNGQLCHDDQADETRALNERALQQAQEENEDDDAGIAPPAYGNAYDNNDDGDGAAPYSYGDRGDMYGDDDDADVNPYDDDTDDDDD